MMLTLRADGKIASVFPSHREPTAFDAAAAAKGGNKSQPAEMPDFANQFGVLASTTADMDQQKLDHRAESDDHESGVAAQATELGSTALQPADQLAKLILCCDLELQMEQPSRAILTETHYPESGQLLADLVSGGNSSAVPVIQWPHETLVELAPAPANFDVQSGSFQEADVLARDASVVLPIGATRSILPMVNLGTVSTPATPGATEVNIELIKNEVHRQPALQSASNALAAFVASGVNVPQNRNAGLGIRDGVSPLQDAARVDRAAEQTAAHGNEPPVESPIVRQHSGSAARFDNQQSPGGQGEGKNAQIASSTVNVGDQPQPLGVLFYGEKIAGQVRDRVMSALEDLQGAKAVVPENSGFSPRVVRMLDVVLNPPDYGSVKLRMSVSSGSVELLAETASAQTASILSQAELSLGQQLRDSGMELSAFQVRCSEPLQVLERSPAVERDGYGSGSDTRIGRDAQSPFGSAPNGHEHPQRRPGVPLSMREVDNGQALGDTKAQRRASSSSLYL